MDIVFIYSNTPKTSRNSSDTASGVNSMIPMSSRDIFPITSLPLIVGRFSKVS